MINQNRKSTGFTLLEILVVVIILGILSSIVISQVMAATKDTKEAALRENLRIIRTQLVAYKQLHASPAGFDSSGNVVDGNSLRKQMTCWTNMDGSAADNSDASHTIRPLLPVFPQNPMSDRNDVKVLGFGQAIVCDGTSSGWIYSVETEEFVPNSVEYGPAGKNW